MANVAKQAAIQFPKVPGPEPTMAHVGLRRLDLAQGAGFYVSHSSFILFGPEGWLNLPFVQRWPRCTWEAAA